jgi:hypothetical protein
MSSDSPQPPETPQQPDTPQPTVAPEQPSYSEAHPQLPGPDQYAPPPQNGMGVAALVMGILQFFCLGLIGSILAVVFGRIGMRKAASGQATNGGTAKAGFVLGIIGLVLFAILIVITVIAVATGNAEWSFNVGTN